MFKLLLGLRIAENRTLLDWLEDHELGFLRVFNYTTFRAPVAIILSFLISLILGPRIIRWLRAQKIADLAGFDQKEIDEIMKSKKGTPTMGGILIVLAIVISVLLMGDLGNFYVRMALVCVVWLAAVGAADDWLKLTVGRRQGSRQGLASREKLAFQLGLALLLGVFTWQYGVNIPEAHTIYFPFFKNLTIDLAPEGSTFMNSGAGAVTIGMLLYVLIATLVLTGSSNAVNLTDGLDGLAGGCMAIVAFTFCILALIVGSSMQVGERELRELAKFLYLPHVRTADEMAVVAGAMTGACLGFLWFNCKPAAVFMGDTGSLALGGLIAYISIVIRQELVLFIVGGIFVYEALSVLIQVSYYKFSRWRYGEPRRIFLMAPVHHHYQKKGWEETQIVVRFWLITAMLAALALASVKLR